MHALELCPQNPGNLTGSCPFSTVALVARGPVMQPDLRTATASTRRCHLPPAAHAWALCKADVLSAYAQFIQHVRGHHDRAEALYKMSLGSDPTHLDTLQYYAIFLEEVRGDLDAAEKLYSIALESTRDGLLDDIDPPTYWRPSTPPGAKPGSLAERDLRHREPADSSTHPPERGYGGSVGDKQCQSINNIAGGHAQEFTRLRQSPKRDQLREKLNRAAARKSPGKPPDLSTGGGERKYRTSLGSDLPRPTGSTHTHRHTHNKNVMVFPWRNSGSGYLSTTCHCKTAICVVFKFRVPNPGAGKSQDSCFPSQPHSLFQYLFRFFQCVFPQKRPAVLICFLFSGSSRGRVDAERRFTDGSYSISDDKTAGTRHLKGYTGMTESISKIS